VFVLFVQDQDRSRDFYASVLEADPVLDVPGMTQFSLPGGAVLGLMPEDGIKKLLGEFLPHPKRASGIPRCELYLTVSEPEMYMRRAVASGALQISPVQGRDWGDRAGYCLDPDKHLLAFAQPTK